MTAESQQHILQVACILLYIRNITDKMLGQKKHFSLCQQGVCDSTELQAHKPAARLQDPQRLLQCLTGNQSRTNRIKNNNCNTLVIFTQFIVLLIKFFWIYITSPFVQ